MCVLLKKTICSVFCFLLLVSLPFTGAHASYRVWRIGNITNTEPWSAFATFGNDVAYQLGDRLFKTNGAAAGTIEITDGLSSMGTVVSYGDYVYYLKWYADYGSEMGRSNGMAGNDEMFLDLVEGSESSVATPICVVNGKLLVAAQKSLYVTNGVLGNMNLLYDFSSLYSMSSLSQYPRDFVLIGDYVYFLVGYVNNTHGLWRTDGTSEGTILLMERSDSSLGDLVEGTGELFFSEDGDWGAKLWKTTGLVSSNQTVKTFSSSSPYDITKVYSTSFDDGVLWFSIHMENELWRSDGTSAGTREIATFAILPIAYGTQLQYMQAAGGFVYFIAADPGITQELWQSDGTAQGTHVVQHEGLTYTNVNFQGQIFNKVLFNANHDGAYKSWTSDGTNLVKVSETVYMHSTAFPYKGGYLVVGSEESNMDLYGVAEEEDMEFLKQPRPKAWYFPGDDLDIFVEISLWALDIAEYQWYKDEMPVPGAQSSILNIPMLDFDDSGVYFCRVTLPDKAESYDSQDAYVNVCAEDSIPASGVYGLCGMVILISLAFLLQQKKKNMV